KVEADERAAEVEEGLMQFPLTLVADRQAAEAMQPGERALRHPAMPPEPGRALHALAGDAALDPAAAQIPPAVAVVVALVAVQLVRPPARALDRRDARDERREDAVVGAVGPGHA